jgi:hypothetical protein
MMGLPPEHEHQRGPRLLIVAPDWETGQSLRARFTAEGFDTFIALSLPDALELLDVQRYNAVIIDESYFRRRSAGLLPSSPPTEH